jgi:hypothetical protein
VRDGDHEKIKALGRRDPNDPNDIPEKDTYVPLPDDFPKPSLTVMWSEANVPEHVRIQLQALHHFKIDVTKPDSFPKHEILEAHFSTVRLSNGKLISPSSAKYLATYCRPVERMSGGNRKKNPSTLEPFNP